ncbi:MAG: AmmeMemoRadiSam system protein B [Rickettsiales bacterium]|nr:AmmeMemoRadiSam system protein B [Rickettsiales bacterium]
MPFFSKSNKILTSKLGDQGWFPKDTDNLKAMLDELLKGTSDGAKIKAMICPHAGYIYSGDVLAKAVINIDQNKYSKIIILGPCHYATRNDLAIVTDYEAIETPIGLTKLLKTDIAKLIENPFFKIEDQIHTPEHSIQMQIPPLQLRCPKTPILPIILGSLSIEASKAIANQIAKIIDENTLILVSSDFTHYGDYFDFTPFEKGNVREEIEKHDMKAIQPIIQNDILSYQKFIRTNNHTICGCYAIEVLMQLCKNNTEFKLCAYKTSGDLTGDYSHSVSYASIIAHGKW